MKKATDLLDFYRRTRGETPAHAPQTTDLQERMDRAGPRLVLIRRSQVFIAAAAAGLVVILAFMLGMALGGGDESDAAPTQRLSSVVAPYVIRVASYPDTDRGRQHAQIVAAQLKRVIANEEVTIHRLTDSQRIVVSMGSWRSAGAKPMATDLLDMIKSLKEDDGSQAFGDANWWRVTR